MLCSPLAAGSHPTDGSTTPNYQPGGLGRAFAGNCVKVTLKISQAAKLRDSDQIRKAESRKPRDRGGSGNGRKGREEGLPIIHEFPFSMSSLSIL